MIKNFLFVLQRFKTSSFINILGLSVALMVFFVVLMQVYYDFTYDRSYATADKLLQFNILQSEGGESDISTNINFQIPERIAERSPEVEAYCMLSSWGEQSFDVDKGGAALENYSLPCIRTKQSFLQVFAPEILAGDTTELFTVDGKAMLSEKTAKRLFGDEDPIGKILIHHYGGESLTVKAIYRDFPENSALANGVYTRLPWYSATEWSFKAFFLIDPQLRATVEEKINDREALEGIMGEGILKYLDEHPENALRLQFLSPNELYLNGTGGSKRITTTLSLLAIGVLTLLIAFVNFINLSLTMAPLRIRGIAIRKIMGVNKVALRLTIAMESVLFTVLALLIAGGGIYLLKGSTFAQELFPIVGISLQSYSGLIAGAAGVILLLAFVIGLYTMRYSTSVEEVEAIKGSYATGVKGGRLRNALIVIQFATAMVLICVSIFIQKQNDFMRNYDWGIPKNNIIYLSLNGLGGQAQSFGQELLRDPRISDYCITRGLPGKVEMSWGRQFEGKQINLTVWSVDDRFFDFFDVEIIAGRKPEHMDSIVGQLVVNEAFLRKYEFDESIVGKDFDAFGPGRIQAIAKDVNFSSLHDSIAPMAFGVLAKWQNFKRILVKLSGTEVPGALRHVEEVWKQFSNDPFEAHFLDETMDELYQKESNMARMIGLFGLIIVVIAVMGVYGMIVFNARYKAREIAIRKVNGSSIREILLLLNRNVLIQLGIAFVLAVPVAWFIANRWLESFAYKISLHWSVFLLSGVIVLLVTLLTVSVQSRRAAGANPMKALSNE
jgi:putative ABC transport system permease protein